MATIRTIVLSIIFVNIALPASSQCDIACFNGHYQKSVIDDLNAQIAFYKNYSSLTFLTDALIGQYHRYFLRNVVIDSSFYPELIAQGGYYIESIYSGEQTTITRYLFIPQVDSMLCYRYNAGYERELVVIPKAPITETLDSIMGQTLTIPTENNPDTNKGVFVSQVEPNGAIQTKVHLFFIPERIKWLFALYKQ